MNNPNINLQRKIKKIIKLLEKNYPDAKLALDYSKPIELLVAVILSAQCTDARVNIVTKSLFKKYKSIADYANADISILENDIRSTGFYRNKAKNIKNSAKILLEKFNQKIPNTMEEILTLPGVARKTANVVLGNLYGIVKGIAVDTHVIRISKLLGLTKNTIPEKIEQDLMKNVPYQNWFKFSYLIQSLGRTFCKARHPYCLQCILNKICSSTPV
jgi:endonuclease-3